MRRGKSERNERGELQRNGGTINDGHDKHEGGGKQEALVEVVR